MIGGSGKRGIDWGRIVSRLATALRRLPSEILDMPFADVGPLYEYWGQCPPVHESLAVIAMAHGWRPAQREASPEEIAAETARAYASGKYVRVDLIQGLKSLKPGDHVPGVGPLPWPEMQVNR